MELQDLDNRFNYHPPTPERAEKHETVRKLLRQVAGYLNENLPEGREKSLVVTHLEEAMFWANAAIARDNGNRE